MSQLLRIVLYLLLANAIMLLITLFLVWLRSHRQRADGNGKEQPEKRSPSRKSEEP